METTPISTHPEESFIAESMGCESLEGALRRGQRKSERKYSWIPDNYQSLEQVTAALAEAGLESTNLIVGIDFTKSNEWTGARSFNRRSLHDIGNGLNSHEQAISIIGKTLSPFHEDNLIPCFKSEIIRKLLLHSEVEMSAQRMDEREDMEMLANPREITGQTGWFSGAKSIAKWPSDLCNRVRSYFAPRSHQDNATEMSTTTTTSISNGSSQDPEQGNVTEMPQNLQSNHSPKHFGMFIFFFVVNLVLAHVRDTYNDSSSSSAAKANWNSYYFGGTITVSFISTLCANILAKYEKPARILEKIGIMFGASGFIMAMVELLLPNMVWIAWIATPIVWIAVILG